ncbi:hypothetical protein ACIRFH_00065 [Streptomyces sp. NPDC093586]|uniref:hypothetical protein n=1 Tax=Streptomyces sp. NPDC093586 TaxID=3366042 RepID=UPI00381C6BC3
MAEKHGVGLDEDTVELEFVQLREDMKDAVRLVLRKRGASARILHHTAFLGLVVAAGATLAVLGGWTGMAAGVGCGLGLVVWGVVMFCVPGISAGRMIEANGHHGLIRVTVGTQGVHMVSEHAELHSGWESYGSWAESDRVFVLRSPDRAGNCALVLVKQGARTPQDVDRLRAILGSRLARA